MKKKRGIEKLLEDIEKLDIEVEEEFEHEDKRIEVNYITWGLTRIKELVDLQHYLERGMR